MRQPMMRRFRVEFLRCFNQKTSIGHDSWPTQAELNLWYRHRRGTERGLKNGTIGTMKRGDPVSEWLCLGVIEFMLQDPAALAQSPLRSLALELGPKHRLLLDYLRAKGVQPREGLQAHDVIDTICTEAFRPQHGRLVEAYRDGLQIMRDFLSVPRLSTRPWTQVALCRDTQIHDVVRWIYIDVGRGLAGPKLPIDDAIELATSHMRIGRNSYAALLSQWRKKSPWSVILGLVKNEPVGVGIALPIMDSEYARIRAGQKMSYEVDESQIGVPTSDLMIEALAFRPREERKLDFDATKTLLLATMSQAAYLTTRPTISIEAPLRFLSFAGSPQNAKRIRWLGFSPIGTFQPDTSVEFYERELWLDPTRLVLSKDLQINNIWFSLQQYLRSHEAEQWFRQFE